MISNKMTNLVKTGSAIRAMFEEGKRMAEMYGKENIYDFSLGNPFVSPPDEVRKALIEIIENEPQMLVHGYMSNSGFEDVRENIAASINKKHGTAFGYANILMTVGAAGALNIVLKTLLNPGDEVILFAPFFGEYNNYIFNYDGVPVVVPPDLETFSINFSALEERVTKKTKAVIINSPNNPTGIIYSEDDIKKLSEILTEKQKQFNSSIYLISDEPYRELVFDNTYVPYVTKYYNNCFVGYSYSKTLSVPGERIGYLVAPDSLDYYDEIISALNVANRILGFVNAPSLFQRVVARCEGLTSDLSLYAKNKHMLYNELTAMGFECIEPKGAFYMFPKSPYDDIKFCEEAKKHRILLVPGTTFACPSYFRVAFCVSEDVVSNSLESFRKLI